jgi:hypothetical protein
VRATQTVRATRTAHPTRTPEPPVECLTLSQKISLIIGIVKRFNKQEGQNGYQAKYDVNSDGIINLDDLEEVIETPFCHKKHKHHRGDDDDDEDDD